MTPAQAKTAKDGITLTLERLADKYFREHSGRVVMGATVFSSRIVQGEFNAIANAAKLIECLTPEQIAAIMSGERVTIPAAGKQAKTGEPDLSFTPMFPS